MRARPERGQTSLETRLEGYSYDLDLQHLRDGTRSDRGAGSRRAAAQGIGGLRGGAPRALDGCREVPVLRSGTPARKSVRLDHLIQHLGLAVGTHAVRDESARFRREVSPRYRGSRLFR